MKFKIIKNLSRDNTNYGSRKNFLRLDKNERVSNFHNKILKKIKISSFDITAYPETWPVYQSIAKNYNISTKNIVLIPGSEFGYRICLEYFRNKKKKIISLAPTFGMVEVYTKLFAIKNIGINYDQNFELDSERLLKNISSKISLIILANPNSPTGTIIKKEKIIQILNKAKKYNITVIIDEAYNGFYKPSFLNYVEKYKNLIVLRTFSKSFGLAGLRVGFLAGNKKLIKEINKYKPMYEVNSVACKVITYFLKNKKFHIDYINETNKGKKYFENELKKLKIGYLKTYANFIHIDLKKYKSKIEKDLKKNKILTRKGPGVKNFENFLRITLGPIDSMKKVIKVLKKYERKF
mgnify:FL=1|tara:strand:- start:2551 stop:3603 length:1053 start_codon:yes stop_codon:yes gene_type:complete